MKAFCALGIAPRLERQEGPSAQDIKRGSWGPNNHSPGPARPRECQTQINSLHSFSTPAKTQKTFSVGAALSLTPTQPISFAQLLFSMQVVGLPSSHSPSEPQQGCSQDPVTPPFPASPTPYSPGPQGLEGVRRGAPGCSLRLRLGGSPLPPQPSTAKRYRDREIPRGRDAQWGQGQCFQRGRDTRHRNIPHSRKFPFRGHRVCARMAQGAGGGGVGGWTKSQQDPSWESAARGNSRRRGVGREASLLLPAKAATRAFFTPHSAVPARACGPPPHSPLNAKQA